MLTEYAYAKINLTLNITGRRSDGYHTLDTVMQTISLCDTLTLEKADGITVECGDLSGEDNICRKAARLFFEKTGLCGGVNIVINKRIPVCGGFGGGSADAAAALRGLNRLYASPLDAEELHSLALSLGADVPFLVDGGCDRCTGIGEILSPVMTEGTFYYCVSAAHTGASTKAMFAEIDKHNIGGGGSEDMVKALEKSDVYGISASLHNDFDSVCCAICPECEEIKNVLLSLGALGTMLTGSGTGVFGVFETKEKADFAAKSLEGKYFASSVQSVPKYD